MLLDPTYADPSYQTPDIINQQPIDPGKYSATFPVWGMLDPVTNQPLYHAMDIPANLPLDPATAESSAFPSLTDLWNKFELAVTPESEGERLVNQIYGRDANGAPITPPNAPLPAYDPQELSTPAVIVAVKNSVTKAGNAIKDNLIKYGVILLGVLFAAVVVYAFAGSYGRKLAS